MSRRIRMFGEDFDCHLFASLGMKERFSVEKWLCAARVILALYCLISTQPLSSALSPQAGLVQILINLYFMYSVLILVLLWLLDPADPAYRPTALTMDLLFAAAITMFTGGPDSVNVVLLFFVVLTAAYRWGGRETNFTSALCVLILFAEVQIFRLWPQYFQSPTAGDFRTEWLLSRGVFLVATSPLFGYLAVRERRLQAESALVTRVLGQIEAGNEMPSAVKSLFAEIAPLYLPRKAFLALRKGNTEEVFSWESERPLSKPQAGMVRNVLQFSKLETAVFSCPAHTWYFYRTARPDSGYRHLLAFDGSGRSVDSLDSKDLHSCVPLSEISSLMVSSFSFAEPLHGRVILVDPTLRGDRRKALRFLKRFLKQVGPAVQNIYLLRDIHRQAEDQVRARLTRDLHDGTLQSLFSAEMQMEVLRRQRSNTSGEFDRRLTALQGLIHEEALNLRDLIEKTKPLNFSAEELPDFLAELVAKFRIETGISTRLETGDENNSIPPNICHEIVRIVQEGLTNVRKHSGAHNVVISLGEDDAGQHKLLIADDGHGFEFKGRVTHAQLDASHRGPGVIKERVRLIGGQLIIDSYPGHWARLEITIPTDLHG